MAEVYFRRALDLSVSLARSPRVEMLSGGSSISLGTLYLLMSERKLLNPPSGGEVDECYAKALAFFSQARDIFTTVDTEHPRTAWAYEVSSQPQILLTTTSPPSSPSPQPPPHPIITLFLTPSSHPLRFPPLSSSPPHPPIRPSSRPPLTLSCTVGRALLSRIACVETLRRPRRPPKRRREFVPSCSTRVQDADSTPTKPSERSTSFSTPAVHLTSPHLTFPPLFALPSFPLRSPPLPSPRLTPTLPSPTPPHLTSLSRLALLSPALPSPHLASPSPPPLRMLEVRMAAPQGPGTCQDDDEEVEALDSDGGNHALTSSRSRGQFHQKRELTQPTRSR